MPIRVDVARLTADLDRLPEKAWGEARRASRDPAR
jgi:hypothetical protein